MMNERTTFYLERAAAILAAPICTGYQCQQRWWNPLCACANYIDQLCYSIGIEKNKIKRT